MSKYDALWAYIQGRNEETLVLSFADIAQIASTPLEQRPDQRGICRFYLGAFINANVFLHLEIRCLRTMRNASFVPIIFVIEDIQAW